MGLFDFLKRTKKDVTAQDNREHLLENGRITDGIIIDSEIDEDGREIVQYQYSIHGVDFESSEILSDEQKKHPLKYAPGAGVGVRFDPKNHHNSILV
jgi:hypothetical protein